MRLSLSLEKRNKKVQSGPHDHEASSSRQEQPASWMTSTACGRTSYYLTCSHAEMPATMWIALIQRHLLNPYSMPGSFRYWGDSSKHNKQKSWPCEAQILIKRDKCWNKIQSMSDSSKDNETIKQWEDKECRSEGCNSN